MFNENLFEKISELKDRFTSFFQHRKKVRALENYSMVGRFPHRPYLTLVKKCLSDGFLGEKEADFLDHMLTKYEMNYLDWAHKTRWLKNLIETKQEKKKLAEQVFFDFDKKKQNVPIDIPIEILPTNKSNIRVRL